jgi:hypothetical protein
MANGALTSPYIPTEEEEELNINPPLSAAGESGQTISPVPQQMPTSGPSPSGATTGSSAPLSGNQQPQGGGPEPSQELDLMKDRGSPETMVQEEAHKNPDKFSETIDATYNAIRSRRAKAGDRAAQLELELLNEKMGINGEEAKEEVFRQAEVGIQRAEEDGKITPKQAKQKRFALKNIYKTIKPEEMSLFLIDFGMRAIMAGETMGDLGALGAAGAGAMGALQERRNYAAEQDIAAGERAATDYQTAQELALEERKVGALEARNAALGGDRSYQGEKVWATNFYRSLGWSDQQIAEVFSGARTPEEMYDSVYDDLMSQRQKAQADEKMNLPDNMRAKIMNENGDMVPVASLSNSELARLARKATQDALKERGALREKDASEYLDAALNAEE